MRPSACSAQTTHRIKHCNTALTNVLCAQQQRRQTFQFSVSDVFKFKANTVEYASCKLAGKTQKKLRGSLQQLTKSNVIFSEGGHKNVYNKPSLHDGSFTIHVLDCTYF